MPGESALAARRRRLGSALAATRELWSPQPWRDLRPPWVGRLPRLHDELLALDDATAAQLASDPAALHGRLRRHLDGIDEIAALSAVAAAPTIGLRDPGRHFDWAIPGRKRRQIEAFAAAVGPPRAPLLDWCGGKGHLGRFLAAQWDCGVDSIDHAPALVAEAARLALRARQTGQGARAVDVLGDAAGASLAGRHVVALHACGDLHRRLVRLAAAAGVVALDLAPCCHDRGEAEVLEPCGDAAGAPRLDRGDRRLAVTGTATAAPRESRLRRRECAWKLGFMALLSAGGEFRQRPLRPIPTTLLREDFAGFCRRLAERDAIALPAGADFAAAEAAGGERWRQVQRLDLLRFAFRRPLEVWMALDLAEHLETRGFAVGVASFCDAALTPRNLLVSARRN